MFAKYPISFHVSISVMAASYHILDIASNASVRHVEYFAIDKGNDDFGVEVIWYTAEGQRDRELNWLERTFAYGFSLKKKNGVTRVYIVSLKNRPFKLKKKDSGEIFAAMKINGRKCEMKRVYVTVGDYGLRIPKVDHVDIIGLDLETGEELSERVKK